MRFVVPVGGHDRTFDVWLDGDEFRCRHASGATASTSESYAAQRALILRALPADETVRVTVHGSRWDVFRTGDQVRLRRAFDGSAPTTPERRRVFRELATREIRLEMAREAA